MNKFIARFAGVFVVGTVATIAIYFTNKPVKSELTPPVGIVFPNPPRELLHSNKNKNRAEFALSTERKVSELMTSGARKHLHSTKIMSLGDFENNGGVQSMTISKDRQIWVVTQKYQDNEEYQGRQGKFKGATVTTVVDAETGGLLSEKIDYKRENFTPNKN